MKRRVALLVVAMLALPIAGLAARADVDCTLGHGWKWCGDHWRRTKLPVKVYANLGSAPPSVSAVFDSAVRAAVSEWERAASGWPAGPATGCPPGTKLMCYVAVTAAGDQDDGKNTVLFGSSLSNPRNLAETHVRYECSPPSFCQWRIKDADIVLNSSLGSLTPPSSWHQATGTEAAVGEAKGALGPYCLYVSPVSSTLCPDWYDLQSVLVHELGHLGVGLDDLGVEVDVSQLGTPACFGEGTNLAALKNDLADAVDILETMFGCHWKGTTNKRSLEAGDRGGLARVMLASYQENA